MASCCPGQLLSQPRASWCSWPLCLSLSLCLSPSFSSFLPVLPILTCMDRLRWEGPEPSLLVRGGESHSNTQVDKWSVSHSPEWSPLSLLLLSCLLHGPLRHTAQVLPRHP